MCQAKGGKLNPVQLRLPLRLAASSPTVLNFGPTRVEASAITQVADRYAVQALQPVVAGVSSAMGVQAVFRPSIVNSAQSSGRPGEKDDWLEDPKDPSDEGDGSNFSAPKTPRPPQGSGRPVSALPPSRTPPPRRPDDKVHTHLFIPADELTNIIDVLSAPDKYPPTKTATLRNNLMLYRAERLGKINEGSLEVTDPKRLKKETELFEWVMAYLKSPVDFSDSARERMIHRLLGHPSVQPLSLAKEDRRDPEVRRRILKPLTEVILADDIMRRAVMALKVPEILDGQILKNSGAVLNGDPGTGKSKLINAVANVYESCGALKFECKVAKMAQTYINSFAANLEKFLSEVLEKARKEGKIAYVFLDEATMLVAKPEGFGNTSDYIIAAQDVAKSYIGNFPELVFAISTNGDENNFADGMVRDLRLEVITVGPPAFREKVLLWKFFIERSGLFRSLTDKQYELLASIVPKNCTGANIEKIPQAYLNDLKLKKHEELSRQKGVLQGFINDLIGAPLPETEGVASEIDFDAFVEFIKKYQYPKNITQSEKTQHKRVGFK